MLDFRCRVWGVQVPSFTQALQAPVILHFLAANPQPQYPQEKYPNMMISLLCPWTHGVPLRVCYVLVTEYTTLPQKQLHERYLVSYSSQVLSHHTCTQQLSSPDQDWTKNCHSILIRRILKLPGRSSDFLFFLKGTMLSLHLRPWKGTL